MANTSIFVAFERMWQHVLTALGNKSDSDHNHNDLYYTEAEVDEKLSNISVSGGGGAPQVQVDWEQGDESSVDYIKNRPFYTNRAKKNILSESDVNLIGNIEYTMVSDSLLFEEGQTYTVVFNGIQYECTAWYHESWNEIVIGNGAYVDASGYGDDVPFAFDSYDGECYLNYLSKGTYVFSIYYGNSLDNVLLPETTYTACYYTIIADSLLFEEGQTYTVVFNGTQYECTAWYHESWDSVAIGNGAYVEANGYGDDVPFAFDSYDGECYLLSPNTGTYVFSIYYGDSLDNVLLPETSVVLENNGYDELKYNQLELEVGNTYIVMCNGTQYECTAWYHESWGGIVIGNGAYVDASGYGDDVPFAFICGGGMAFLYSSGSGTYVFSIYGDSLDDVLIPETTLTIYDDMNPWVSLTLLQFKEGNSYIVTFDGVEYECSPYWLRDTLVIGNGAFVDAYGYGDDVPFFVYNDGDYNYLSGSVGDHTISIGISTEEIKKIDKKYLPDDLGASQADWNQSDETANDYIKNRPFGDEVKTIIPIFNEAEIPVTYYSVIFSYTQPFVVGDEYTVVFNGETYKCVAWNGPDNDICIGSGDVYGGEEQGEDVPFVIYYWDGSCTLKVRENGTYTVGIYKETYALKKIDKKYLPDDVIAQADWNQTNETANDYIKNRPFGEVKTLDAIIPETTVEGFSLMQNSIYAVQNPFSFNPNSDTVYTVVWDGVSYDVELVVITQGSMGYMGNENYVNMTAGGDIPFAIIFAGGGIFLATESTANSHTFSVGIPTEEIKKIDKKYLPDDIALKSYVDSVTPKITYGTTDLTAGTSALEKGTFYFVYE